MSPALAPSALLGDSMKNAQQEHGTTEALVLETFGQRPSKRNVEVLPSGGAGVIVDVSYGGICGTDLHLIDGRMDIPLPQTMGHEGVGTVADIVGDSRLTDAKGSPLTVGTEIGWASSIACGECPACVSQKRPTLCPARRISGINIVGASGNPVASGSWARRIFLPQGSTIVQLPAGVSQRSVIAFGCAGPTVVHGFERIRGPIEGADVIVQGSGPVGVAAGLYARHLGARRIVMIGGPSERLQMAKSLGAADYFIDLEEVPDPASRTKLAREALSPAGDGAGVVVECAGVPGAVQEGLGLVKRGGTYLVLGQYTNAGPTDMVPHLITHGEMDVLGSWAYGPVDYVAYIDALRSMVDAEDLDGLVSTYPLHAAETALRDVAAGEVLKGAFSVTDGAGG